MGQEITESKLIFGEIKGTLKTFQFSSPYAYSYYYYKYNKQYHDYKGHHFRALDSRSAYKFEGADEGI